MTALWKNVRDWCQSAANWVMRNQIWAVVLAAAALILLMAATS